MAKTRHRISGRIENNTPQHIIDHPVLGKYLEVIDEAAEAKAIVPELVSAKHAERIATESKRTDEKEKE